MFNTDLGNSPLPSRTRGKIYNSLVLGILLYGCESWVLTEMLRATLEAFHNPCVRGCVPCAGLFALASGLSAEAMRPSTTNAKIGVFGSIREYSSTVTGDSQRDIRASTLSYDAFYCSWGIDSFNFGLKILKWREVMSILKKSNFGSIRRAARVRARAPA